MLLRGGHNGSPARERSHPELESEVVFECKAGLEEGQ